MNMSGEVCDQGRSERKDAERKRNSHLRSLCNNLWRCHPHDTKRGWPSTRGRRTRRAAPTQVNSKQSTSRANISLCQKTDISPCGDISLICCVLIKTTLSVNFLHEQTRVLEDPLFPKRGRTQKRNARSVRRTKQSKSPWRRGMTSVSHPEGSVHEWCVFSRDRTRPTSSVNAINSSLVAALFVIDAWKVSRCVAVLRRSLQTRGSEESRLPNKIRERADLQDYITSTTVFFMTRGLSPFDFMDCCAVYVSHRASQKLQTVLSPARTRKDDTKYMCLIQCFF